MHEEGHGRRLGDVRRRQVLGEIRQGERSHGKDLFGLQMQHRSACHQDGELRAESEEMLELWRGGHDLLKVVKQQQQAFVLQNQLHQLEQWEPFALVDRKLLGDGGQEQVRVTDGGKGDERDPIDEVLGQGSPEVDSQAGFANATAARQREEANVGTSEEATDGCHVLLTPNERRELNGEGRRDALPGMAG